MNENTLENQVPSQAQFDNWISSLPPHVADVVREHSPFVPHRLKSTGQTVYIARFQEGSPGEPPVKLSVIAPQSANPTQSGDLIFDVTPSDLYTLAS